MMIILHYNNTFPLFLPHTYYPAKSDFFMNEELLPAYQIWKLHGQYSKF